MHRLVIAAKIMAVGMAVYYTFMAVVLVWAMGRYDERQRLLDAMRGRVKVWRLRYLVLAPLSWLVLYVVMGIKG